MTTNVIILGIDDPNYITARWGKRQFKLFKKQSELTQWCWEQETQGKIVMCSSSMDFPEQYTTNKKIIAIAKGLRCK